MKKLLEQDHTAQFQPFNYEETIELVNYFVSTYIPRVATGRQVRVQLPDDFSETLAKSYQLKGFSGRDISEHIQLTLVYPLETAPVSPGSPIKVTIDKDSLAQLDPEQKGTNPFSLDFIQENINDVMKEILRK